jgi:hypothetical protein
MSSPARHIVRLLCVCGLILLVAAALNFVVDPLQLLRPARFYPAMYSTNSRMQNAGLIRSQDFDTVLMGSSLAVHFRQSDIDRLLGVRSVKLAMTGADSGEQSLVLAAALKRRPKRVIWQVDDWIFRDTFRNAADTGPDLYLPADLYRRNARGIAGYLLSGAMARESAWMLARSIPPLQPLIARLTTGVLFKFPIPRVDDINALRPDFDVSAAYNAKKAIAAFRSAIDPVRGDYLAETYNYDAMVWNFERDAFALMTQNPDVQFDVYLPPYSILQWVTMRDVSPATLKIVYDFSAYIARRLTQLPNVRLYDFRAVKEITHDLRNYADLIHHSPDIDLKILFWLAAGNDVVDRAAPSASLDRLKAQVEAYRVEGIRSLVVNDHVKTLVGRRRNEITRE